MNQTAEKLKACLENALDLVESLDNPRSSIKDSKIILEVGHGEYPDGGTEYGAEITDPRIREWDLNLIAANGAKAHLESLSYTNVHVVDDGDYLSIIGRKYSDADIFVSVHHNSSYDGDAQGCEALVHEDLYTHEDEDLAAEVSDAIRISFDKQGIKMRDRGVKHQGLGVLRGFREKAKKDNACCLSESFFISGFDVREQRAHNKWARIGGVGIAMGIHNYLHGNVD